MMDDVRSGKTKTYDLEDVLQEEDDSIDLKHAALKSKEKESR